MYLASLSIRINPFSIFLSPSLYLISLIFLWYVQEDKKVMQGLWLYKPFLSPRSSEGFFSHRKPEEIPASKKTSWQWKHYVATASDLGKKITTLLPITQKATGKYFYYLAMLLISPTLPLALCSAVEWQEAPDFCLGPDRSNALLLQCKVVMLCFEPQDMLRDWWEGVEKNRLNGAQNTTHPPQQEKAPHRTKAWMDFPLLYLF